MAVGVKTGGRKAGTPNKVTRELRERLKEVFYEELDNLPNLLKDMQPKERVELLIRLAPFVLPKVSPVGMSAGEDLAESWNSW
jgi:hypothetical protein